MVESFIEAGVAADILDLEKRAFATDLALGKVVSLVLYRDTEQDATAVEQAPQTVLVVLLSRPGTSRFNREQSDLSDIILQQGEFQKFAPFNVQKDDRFTLDGIAGKILAIFPQDTRGVVRAAFELES